jgi:hypothetical protein|tara:strand:- start:645 stop:1067 length:423 start_codon:yes stop_codon:yes gene_type:complete
MANLEKFTQADIPNKREAGEEQRPRRKMAVSNLKVVREVEPTEIADAVLRHLRVNHDMFVHNENEARSTIVTSPLNIGGVRYDALQNSVQNQLDARDTLFEDGFVEVLKSLKREGEIQYFGTEPNNSKVIALYGLNWSGN